MAGRGQQLGDRVPVGGGVHGVVEGGGEAEGGGGGRRVERERRPGDGPGPERADVGPAAGVLEPADVPGQGEAVGGELEGPEHRLGRLEVGEPGHDGVRTGGPAGPDQGVDQPGQGLDGVGAGLLEPQVQVGGDLVVAAAAGVELAPGRADQLGQAALDRAVDVLVAVAEGERARLQLPRDLGQAVEQELALPLLQHPGRDQAAHVGPAPGHVLAPQPPVDGQRRGVGPHARVGRPREPPRPQRPGPFGPPGVTHPGGPWPRCGRAGPTGPRTRARRRGRRRRRSRRWPGRAGTGPARPAGRSAGSARATARGGPRR